MQTTKFALQDEARRLADQVHALEDTRNRWNAEIAAREAALAQKENELAANVRQKEAEQRRRLAQDEQVLTPHMACCYCCAGVPPSLPMQIALLNTVVVGIYAEA